ncbi:MAG: zinc ribbon domain-containing protein [Candidatus Hodarchaeota archaeon]
MDKELPIHIAFFINEVFLKKAKNLWETHFGKNYTDFEYTFVIHVIPDKKKKELNEQFYVEFTLSKGNFDYRVVHGETPVKPKQGISWRGDPSQWKKAINTGSLSHVKLDIDVMQFAEGGQMERIMQLLQLFGGHLFSIAKQFGFLEKGSNQELIMETMEKKEPIDPEKVKADIQRLKSEIEASGWNPQRGKALGECYFNIGLLDDAEREYCKYLDATNATDVPVLMFFKWSMMKGGTLNLNVGMPGGLSDAVGSVTPEKIKELYEMGRVAYLKRHGIQEQKNTCQSCGKENKPSAKFCLICGNRL